LDDKQRPVTHYKMLLESTTGKTAPTTAATGQRQTICSSGKSLGFVVFEPFCYFDDFYD